jgi:Bacteriophage HK97-gp10, putative tail-component
MSQLINMRLTGLNHVTQRIVKILPQEVERQLAADVRTSAIEVATALTALIPRKSGKTLAQLKIKTKNKGLTARIGVYGDRGFIARFLNFGTKPHRIFARNGGALALASGKYATQVMHPGIKPLNFLKAIDGLRDRVQQRFGAGLRVAVQRAARK